MSYEVDLFGRLARASEAAALDAQASEALLQSTRLLVQADVAQAYLTLRALDDERAIVSDTVAAYRGTLDLTERRNRAGDVAELEVARARAELASTEAEAAALSRQRAVVEHALAVLVGEVASGFSFDVANARTSLPVVPAGVPSTVLARRPDVSAAMHGLKAAQARVGVAQAAWLPSLSLTASGGYASSEVSDLFKWSVRTWGIGALFSLPALRWRAPRSRRARLRGRTSTRRSRRIAIRCWWRSRMWKTSCQRCVGLPSSRRRRRGRWRRRSGRPPCPGRGIATAW